MKILMFGRGTISAQYGWALENAGHEVVFYVRPERLKQYSPYVNLNLLDGRGGSKREAIKEKWPIRMVDEIAPDTYDLIMISVNHHQFENASKIIGPQAGNSTILVFNNIWKDLESAGALLPKNQTIWGFPGGGGGFKDEQTLSGGFMKTIFLEAEKSATSPRRQKEIADLFQRAGFKLSIQKNIEAWYWDHFITNVAMAAQALKEGGYQKLYQSKGAMKSAVLLNRELLPLIRARGHKVAFSRKILFNLPAGLLGFVMHKVMTSNGLVGQLMVRAEDTGTTARESAAHFPMDIWKEREKYNVELPRLTALSPYFTSTEEKKTTV